MILISLKQVSCVQGSARKGKKLLHTASLFPVHQPLRRWGEVKCRHDVCRVRELCFHLFTGDGFDLVDDKLPFPFCPDVSSQSGSVDRSECKTFFFVVQQSRLFADLETKLF